MHVLVYMRMKIIGNTLCIHAQCILVHKAQTHTNRINTYNYYRYIVYIHKCTDMENRECVHWVGVRCVMPLKYNVHKHNLWLIGQTHYYTKGVSLHSGDHDARTTRAKWTWSYAHYYSGRQANIDQAKNLANALGHHRESLLNASGFTVASAKEACARVRADERCKRRDDVRDLYYGWRS